MEEHLKRIQEKIESLNRVRNKIEIIAEESLDEVSAINAKLKALYKKEEDLLQMIDE